MVLSNHSHNVTGSEQMNPQFEPSDLGAVSQTKAGRTIFHALASRERFRRTTDLSRLYRFIVATIDDSMREEEFLGVFKHLSDMKLGKLIIGRKLNPNRFRWYYNLREAASAALDNKPLSDLTQLPKPPRTKRSKVVRRKKSRSKKVKPTFTPYVAETPVQEPSKPGITITINVPPGANSDEVKAYIDLAKSFGK